MTIMYEINEKDIEHVKRFYLVSNDPIIIKSWPSKDKRKYILSTMIVKLFKEDVIYQENDVNQILQNIYEDYVTIRRCLIDYGFLKRTKDCSTYWIEKKKP
jgi:hypothetical protein